MLLVSQDQSIAAVKHSNEMNILFNEVLCGPVAMVVDAASDDFMAETYPFHCGCQSYVSESRLQHSEIHNMMSQDGSCYLNQVNLY